MHLVLFIVQIIKQPYWIVCPLWTWHKRYGRGIVQIVLELQCSAQVFKRAGCHLKRAHLAR